MKCFLYAKIHRATVTEARPDYVGSIGIDRRLLELTGIEEGERVLVADRNNGNRLETYVIPASRGQICANGPAALLINPGDEVVIMAFAWQSERPKPKIILVDRENNFLKYLEN